MSFSDIIEIQQLGCRYAAAVDGCDTAAFQRVFHQQGRLRSYQPDSDAPFADLRGPEQLAAVPDAMRGMYRHTAHMMTNHLVDVAGDHATGEVLCVARHLGTDADQPVSINIVIRYIDEYVREGGAWLIMDRQIRFLWSERHQTADSGMGRAPEGRS